MSLRRRPGLLLLRERPPVLRRPAPRNRQAPPGRRDGDQVRRLRDPVPCRFLGRGRNRSRAGRPAALRWLPPGHAARAGSAPGTLDRDLGPPWRMGTGRTRRGRGVCSGHPVPPPSLPSPLDPASVIQRSARARDVAANPTSLDGVRSESTRNGHDGQFSSLGVVGCSGRSTSAPRRFGLGRRGSCWPSDTVDQEEPRDRSDEGRAGSDERGERSRWWWAWRGCWRRQGHGAR